MIVIIVPFSVRVIVMMRLLLLDPFSILIRIRSGIMVRLRSSRMVKIARLRWALKVLDSPSSRMMTVADDSVSAKLSSRVRLAGRLRVSSMLLISALAMLIRVSLALNMSPCSVHRCLAESLRLTWNRRKTMFSLVSVAIVLLCGKSIYVSYG